MLLFVCIFSSKLIINLNFTLFEKKKNLYKQVSRFRIIVWHLYRTVVRGYMWKCLLWIHSFFVAINFHWLRKTYTFLNIKCHGFTEVFIQHFGKDLIRWTFNFPYTKEIQKHWHLKTTNPQYQLNYFYYSSEYVLPKSSHVKTIYTKL